MTTPLPATIVVADDEADIRRLVAFSLRRRGHTILEATTGTEAEDLIRETQPDLAILDVTMPDQTGIDVVRALASDERCKHIPIVLLSAKGQPQEIEAGLAVGATAYLVKPFSPRDLAEQVGLILARAGMGSGEVTE